MIAVFLIAAFVFVDRPEIAMWIGFLFASYGAIANDSIQTLGTFLASNQKLSRKWLWIFIGESLYLLLLTGGFLTKGTFLLEDSKRFPTL